MRGVTLQHRTIKPLYAFQPALPMRGVTPVDPEELSEEELFQPALPMRGVTTTRRQSDSPASYFNPHSPCGE